MNYPELKAAISRSGLSRGQIAGHLGLSENAVYNKLSGKSEFKGSEIKTMARLLSLSASAVNFIFFDNEVN